MFCYKFLFSNGFVNFRFENLNFYSPIDSDSWQWIIYLTWWIYFMCLLSVSISSNIFCFLCKNYGENNGYIAPSYEDESSSSGNKIKMKLKEFHKSAASFTALDRNYLTPFFTSHNGDEDEEAEPFTSARSFTSSRSGFHGQSPYASPWFFQTTQHSQNLLCTYQPCNL